MASKGFVGRVMVSAGIMIIMAFISQSTFAREITVFDVRKNIPLSDDEPSYKDFFINGGFQDGLRKGMVVEVTRRISVYDSTQNHAAGELLVNVGRLKVIHVQKSLAVGRLISVESPESLPMLDYDTIMSGDILDMENARTEKDGKKSILDPGTLRDQFKEDLREELMREATPVAWEVSTI